MKLYLPVLGVLSFFTITLLTGPVIAHENRKVEKNKKEFKEVIEAVGK